MIPFLISGSTEPTEGAIPPLKLFNTLTRKKEIFSPIKDDYVRMYNCGPTVYGPIHIGNLRAFVFADILRRTFLLNRYKVMQVMNITDVGHLTSDADHGEDKMTLAVKREELELTLENMYEVATKFMNMFLDDMDSLNIKRPSVIPRASEHIKGNIAMIETLMQKEYAYRTADGVYFDTSRFKEYGKLGGIDTEAQKAGARVAVNDEKRNPIDFALWKKDDNLGWESPWGRGFPGWHIECSAMAMEYLGKEIDVHTGGIDLIGTHHNNEIAQSECASGKPFARFWMHNEFINIEGTKISKSLKNTISLNQIIEHGYNPLAYRYWLLTGHYRTKMNFSFVALDGASNALTRLHRHFAEKLQKAKGGTVDEGYALRLLMHMNNDLDTPNAIAVLWEVVKDGTLTASVKRSTMLHFDKILGLGLLALAKRDTATVQLTIKSISLEDVAGEVRQLVEEREESRKNKDWKRADEIREKIQEKGYDIEDKNTGPVIKELQK